MFKILVILCLQLIIIFSDDDLLSKFQQHDYDLEFTRGELDNYNGEVFKYAKIVTFKYNRSVAVVNVTWEFKLQMDHSKTDIIIQAYKFLSNEYRIFPLRFQVNLCNAFEHNTAGVRDALNRCGNMTDCSSKKDQVYHVCNAYPDKSRFPPYIPNGEYKIEGTLVNKDTILGVVNGYGKVSRKTKMH